MNEEELIGMSDVVNGDEVAEAGKMVFTIAGTEKRTFDDGNVVKYLTFEGGRKTKLGKTRERQLAELFNAGKPVSIKDLVGKTVELTAAKVQTPSGRKNSISFGPGSKTPF
jgi:hypothetical protein